MPMLLLQLSSQQLITVDIQGYVATDKVHRTGRRV